MSLSFAGAIRVGQAVELVEVQRGEATETAAISASTIPRGLAMASLKVTRNWDGLWGLLRRRQEIYFLSVAFDISKNEPIVLPPAEVAADAVYRVRKGETINFTLGDGAPIFPARIINGGLIIYIMVCEADKGTRHVGDVMAQVHENLAMEGSLTQVIASFLANPGSALAEQAFKAATAALQPIATVLSNSRDEYVGLFTGIYPARGPWRDRLTGTNNGTVIELRELR